MKTTSLLTTLALAATAGLAFGNAHANGDLWTNDFAAAKQRAAKENKSLLLDFTGSDWCGWCIKLRNEVFDKDEFKDGVKDKFVLVELDFPQDQSLVDEKTKAQNNELQKEFEIRGYPTIMLTDAEGKPFAATGYQAGGPEKYVKHLDELLTKRAARDKAFGEAAKLEGVDKAKALVAALNDVEIEDSLKTRFYGNVVDEIKAADPDDKSGFVKKLELEKKHGEFMEKLQSFAQDGDHDGALKFVEKTLEDGEFDGEIKQEITAIKGRIYAFMGKFDEALKAMDDAKEIAPDSQLGQNIGQLKAQINQMKEQGVDQDSDEE